MKSWPALLFFAASPLLAQIELVLPDGNPAPALYDLGAVDSGQAASARFLLRNRATAAASLASLGVAGVGYSLVAPATPFGIPAQGIVEFTVNFQAIATGSYSAVLHADGIAILLTASVLPSLTYRTDSGAGLVPLTALDFGSVVRGATAQRRVTVRNESSVILTVPPILVEGESFALSAAAPGGQSLQPQQAAEFNVVFSPQSAGPRQGTLSTGARSFPLAGIATEPPLPNVALTIDLQPVASARQGSLVIRFEAPAQVAGTGTATLDFRGPADPAIVFAAGGRSASFAVAPGDTQAVLGFQTGTTAGTLTFSVQLGASTDQQTVAIAPAKPTVTAIQSIRSSASIELRVTGFDNTRTLGTLAFTFYDGAGKTLAVILGDAAADFAKYFAASDLGGVFLLRAVFPVNGDASQLVACDVSLTNAAGVTIERVNLP